MKLENRDPKPNSGQQLQSRLNLDLDGLSEPYQPRRPAFQEYCETIYGLDEDNLQVIQARIAERLNISRPAVSETIKRMRAEGLVVEGTGKGTIKLTEAGRSLGATIVRRHRIAERFLTDVLGLSWAQSHKDASKLEHVISPEMEQSMLRLLEDPTTCPHGNPIPGSAYETPDMVPLANLSVGATFTVRRIPEELEFEPGMLEFLEQSRVIPGSAGIVVARSPKGTYTLEIAGQSVGLDRYTTSKVLVSTVPEQAATEE